MINYGLILKEKEKDIPSHFCRATFIISNVGDLVYCFGRMIRFPDLKAAYLAEMKLALADIIIQCEMAGYDQSVEFGKQMSSICDHRSWSVPHYEESDIEKLVIKIVEHASHALRTSPFVSVLDNFSYNYSYYVSETSIWAHKLCEVLKFDIDDIRYLGFQHVMERFQQFEKEGWK